MVHHSLSNILKGATGGVYLEVRAGDTGSDLLEERLLDPDELRRLNHIQDLLNLPKEHHLYTNAHIFFSTRHSHDTWWIK